MQRPIRHKRRFPILLLLLGISMHPGIAGCGRSDTTIPAATLPEQNQPSSTVSPTEQLPSPTPTMHPLDATKQADQDNEQRMIATARARPTAAVHSPRPTPGPTIPPFTGIEVDCDSGYVHRYQATNCWSGPVGPIWMFVVAGSQPDHASQGLVGLYEVDSNDHTSEFLIYPAPTQAGPLTITAVNLPLVELTAQDGGSVRFNLQTRAYEAATRPTPNSALQDEGDIVQKPDSLMITWKLSGLR